MTELAVERQIEFEYIHPGRSEKSHSTSFSMRTDELPNLINRNSTGLSHTRGLGFCGSHADIRVQPAG